MAARKRTYMEGESSMPILLFSTDRLDAELYCGKVMRFLIYYVVLWL